MHCAQFFIRADFAFHVHECRQALSRLSVLQGVPFSKQGEVSVHLVKQSGTQMVFQVANLGGDRTHTVSRDAQKVSEFVEHLKSTLGLSDDAGDPAALIKEASYLRVVRETRAFKDFFQLNCADTLSNDDSDSTLGAQTQEHFDLQKENSETSSFQS